jgi:hypothetical protein
MGRPASGFAGVDPQGRQTTVVVDGEATGARAPTGGTSKLNQLVLVFLTSSCQPCQLLWGGAAPLGDGVPTFIVTPSPSTESRRKVAELAPLTVPVVMSSEAWHAYGVTRAPWLVVLDRGIVAAEGPAPADWAGIAGIAATEAAGGDDGG